jgi:hypothetical protein
MDLDRTTTAKLKLFAQVLREARDRNASEADTVVLLTKLLEDVLGYDPLAGEISREQQIQGRYCDIAVKVEGEVALLIEAKQSGSKLGEKEIEQAENYASRSGIEWVALTNGSEWQLYHVTFAEGEGIAHELAFTIDLVNGVESEGADIKKTWDTFGLMSKSSISDGGLEEFWAAKTALNPGAVVRALFCEGTLAALRRELRRTAGFMLTIEDVFDAVRDVLSKEALMAAGDIRLPRKKKRRKTKVIPAAAPAEPMASPTSTPPDANPAQLLPA